jgi:hypothetical protein
MIECVSEAKRSSNRKYLMGTGKHAGFHDGGMGLRWANGAAMPDEDEKHRYSREYGPDWKQDINECVACQGRLLSCVKIQLGLRAVHFKSRRP